MKIKFSLTLLIAFGVQLSIYAQEAKNSFNEADQIIKSFVNDYKNDRYASEKRTIGIVVPDIGSWVVNVSGHKSADDMWEVSLSQGKPDTPTYIYSIQMETLKAIHEGKINALTAQGKAFSSDYTPMRVDEMDGFYPSEEDDGKLNSFSFHFWTKGFPEVIPFREDATRRAHGSNFVIFYYEKGLRTAWYNILPGEKVRDDAREQAAPFPMMGIAIKGTAKGIVDGAEVTMTEGHTVFIPAGVNHKWWNETDESVEVILVMWGEGA